MKFALLVHQSAGHFEERAANDLERLASR